MASARKLLIVDDSALMREVIRRACAQPGDIIIEAANGQEAIAAYAANQPDWAVLDVKMPVMDGLTAAREIRRQFPQASIVIVTQDDQAEWREAARIAGAHHFLLKDDLTQLAIILT